MTVLPNSALNLITFAGESVIVGLINKDETTYRTELASWYEANMSLISIYVIKEAIQDWKTITKHSNLNISGSSVKRVNRTIKDHKADPKMPSFLRSVKHVWIPSSLSIPAIFSVICTKFLIPL